MLHVVGTLFAYFDDICAGYLFFPTRRVVQSEIDESLQGILV
jgi:hypothetical protein